MNALFSTLMADPALNLSLVEPHACNGPVYSSSSSSTSSSSSGSSSGSSSSYNDGGGVHFSAGSMSDGVQLLFLSASASMIRYSSSFSRFLIPESS